LTGYHYPTGFEDLDEIELDLGIELFRRVRDSFELGSGARAIAENALGLIELEHERRTAPITFDMSAAPKAREELHERDDRDDPDFDVEHPRL